MQRNLLLASLLATTVGAPTLAQSADCDQEWVCIDVAESAAGVVLSGRNLSPYPVTLTLQVQGPDAAEGEGRTVTHTIGGGSSREFLRLASAEDPTGERYRYWYDWTIGDRHALHDDSHVYRLPYAEGESFRILQGFGSRFSHTGLEHYAIDFDMPEGTPVHAARDGVVARVEESHSIGCWRDGCGRYANYIVILHDDGTTGEYYHLQHNGALVEPGQRIMAGELIGLSGNTGHSTMPHLHFAVYRAGEWGSTQSVPIRLRHSGGIAEAPKHGQRLVAD